ncbi:MAG: ribosome assembly RNA-binding protein YhbY [Longimicrobiales bacterium]|nr:ribosome assembly RNA-binding protein YhbY [Longimicrobiales bacterium]
MAAPLTSRQRAHLRAIAHGLRPVVRVGHEGLAPAVVEAIREAFNTRELIKVKALDTAPANARGIAEGIVEAIPEARVAQTIGRTVVLYRADPENPEIELPD